MQKKKTAKNVNFETKMWNFLTEANKQRTIINLEKNLHNWQVLKLTLADE